jgi:hypothetical protein
MINTYGFGYNLNSTLLQEIARIGRGNYGFIPDGTFVGTIFVNSLANLVSTVGRDLVVHLVSEKDVRMKIPGGYNTTSMGDATQVHLGTMQLGQSKSFLLELGGDPGKLTIVAKYNNFREDCVITKEYLGGDPDPMVYETLARVSSVDTMVEAASLFPRGAEAARDLLNKHLILIRSYSAKSKYVQDLIKDLEGQVTEALSRSDWFDRWGIHYIRSLVDAHYHQLCNNFKDPGVQHYGGMRFRQLRGTFEDVFVKMAPPKPSRKRAHHRAVRNMGGYHDASGGCFHGDCKVAMANGTFKAISELIKGDEIKTPQGKTKIACVVKHNRIGRSTNFVRLGDCLITPWHPVRREGTWYFPSDIGRTEEFKVEAMYNLVLEDHNIAIVGGEQCVTLGHSFTGPVVSHAYFGSEDVIKDLKRINGWQTGRVLVNEFTRNAQRLVVGLA